MIISRGCYEKLFFECAGIIRERTTAKLLSKIYAGINHEIMVVIVCNALLLANSTYVLLI